MSTEYRQIPASQGWRQHDGGAVIRVIGVGGAGCNAVARMMEDGITGVEFIVVNTDAQALAASPVTRQVRLGESLTRGLGAGGDPVIGARAAQESLEELRALLRGADLVFVTAGMGGGTGTGAAPVVARLARELGALTVAVVSSPFQFEGTRRAALAAQGVMELRPNVDTMIVVPNERLLAIVDHHRPFTEALHIGDSILHQGVRGISDLITTPGVINLDFADVRSVVAGAGTALMAIGEAAGDRRALEATQRAIESPLLERDIRGASRILLNITGSSDLTLMEVNEAASLVQSLAQPDAIIIFGTVQDEQLAGMMRVTLIATGFAPLPETTHPLTTGIAAPTRRDETAVSGELAAATELPALLLPLLPEAGWQLPADDDMLVDEPTIALPALTFLRPPPPIADVTQHSGSGQRAVRTVETAWTADHPAESADVYDIPAFLRRTDPN